MTSPKASFLLLLQLPISRVCHWRLITSYQFPAFATGGTLILSCLLPVSNSPRLPPATHFSRACYQIQISRVCHRRYFFPRLQPDCFLHCLTNRTNVSDFILWNSGNCLPEININLTIHRSH